MPSDLNPEPHDPEVITTERPTSRDLCACSDLDYFRIAGHAAVGSVADAPLFASLAL
jgi:hypothetical protein